jgi:hypothetical protein
MSDLLPDNRMYVISLFIPPGEKIALDTIAARERNYRAPRHAQAAACA